MSIEANKQLVRTFFERCSANDLEGYLGLLAEDATWWIAGKPDSPAASGELTKAQVRALFEAMFPYLDGGMHMTIRGMVGEGDQVAVEVEGHGKLRDGRVYNNDYHMVITTRDGLIVKIREYLDTHYVVSLFHTH